MHTAQKGLSEFRFPRGISLPVQTVQVHSDPLRSAWPLSPRTKGAINSTWHTFMLSDK